MVTEIETRIRRRLDSLTKPPGSLGRLEELALQVGLIQGTDMPSVGRKAMLLFCADHGVVEEGVSPFPQEVTRQMVANFRAGGAAGDRGGPAARGGRRCSWRG
jgi:nicotinate-nucleotide--dimethylbenzimidazole phosphoribosyltransferase